MHRKTASPERHTCGTESSALAMAAASELNYSRKARGEETLAKMSRCVARIKLIVRITIAYCSCCTFSE